MLFYKSFISLVVILFLFSSCGGGTIIDTNPNLAATYEIVFVYRDGLDIPIGDCINPTTEYALKISAKDNIERAVSYQFNGVTYEISILTNDSKLIDIDLIYGVNTANISGSQIVSERYLVSEVNVFDPVIFD